MRTRWDNLVIVTIAQSVTFQVKLCVTFGVTKAPCWWNGKGNKRVNSQNLLLSNNPRSYVISIKRKNHFLWHILSSEKKINFSIILGWDYYIYKQRWQTILWKQRWGWGERAQHIHTWTKLCFQDHNNRFAKPVLCNALAIFLTWGVGLQHPLPPPAPPPVLWVTLTAHEQQSL